uniref:Potassium channel domain-containing protein n=1 Tax=Phaeomonas parva TaxID=124430 RepID=A0A7S1TRS2_9STRA|mmetsp:Transcript_14822/g.44668  ORF Transcript_14822/g.44668 Transcript_14822/m.44668 type:complete len:564 (+) Transcript_14822:194-1885(+)|eukprot:CAMPEP_0118882042 /NCGR_PEP_ID=MMETSP1163-20130328/21379_1 /TAXON_ID=124430 /ORGANISM="Phaeomonas parva, Strain CCMP2877" /LENGTH=563 /DNA_ID=CAMNT_0006818987 /DNA_START=182 /DNA_END=1873 /DNA_ORIENTATION=+
MSFVEAHDLRDETDSTSKLNLQRTLRRIDLKSATIDNGEGNDASLLAGKAPPAGKAGFLPSFKRRGTSIRRPSVEIKTTYRDGKLHHIINVKKVDDTLEGFLCRVFNPFRIAVRHLRVVIAVTSIIGFVLSVVECEVLYANKNEPNHDVQALKAGVSATTLILILCIYAVHMRAATWRFREKKRNRPGFINTWDGATVFHMICDIAIAAVHTPYGLHRTWKTYLTLYSVAGDPIEIYPHYSLESLTAPLMTLRLLFCLPVLHQVVGSHGVSSKLLEKVTATKLDHWSFTMKVMLKQHPFKFVACVMCFFIVQSAYCIRIFERAICIEPPIEIEDLCGQKSIFSYESFGNTFWNVLITMSTVGFGDMFPRTAGGRLFAIYACIMGVVMIALFVSVITDKITMTAKETKAYALMKQNELKLKAADTSATLLQTGMRYLIARRREKLGMIKWGQASSSSKAKNRATAQLKKNKEKLRREFQLALANHNAMRKSSERISHLTSDLTSIASSVINMQQEAHGNAESGRNKLVIVNEELHRINELVDARFDSIEHRLQSILKFVELTEE